MDTHSIFVFGSNLAGRHGAGAARYALLYYGAELGKGRGRTGNSYAIPTKDTELKRLTLPRIQLFVDEFLIYAKERRFTVFKVSRIGCGLAGYEDSDIAPMFRNATTNCQFDTAWAPWLGAMNFTYWGHR